jgi:hypothetical protein
MIEVALGIITVVVSVLSGLCFWGMSSNIGQSIKMFFVSCGFMFFGLFWFLPALEVGNEPGVIIVISFLVLFIAFAAGAFQGSADCNNRRTNKAGAS